MAGWDSIKGAVKKIAKNKKIASAAKDYASNSYGSQRTTKERGSTSSNKENSSKPPADLDLGDV